MSGTPTVTSYDITVQDETGEMQSQTVDASDIDADATVPKKGDSFEYEHTEVRVGQVVKVVANYDDGSVQTLTELGDTHHALAVDAAGDEPVDLAHVDDPADPALATADPAQVTEQ
jgi:prolyl-tRNA editing enzyme YbaK/EbsC (Cys-tRNA(Pro) deacylase)